MTSLKSLIENIRVLEYESLGQLERSATIFLNLCQANMTSAC